jgi:hypothetical protein
MDRALCFFPPRLRMGSVLQMLMVRRCMHSTGFGRVRVLDVLWCFGCGAVLV